MERENKEQDTRKYPDLHVAIGVIGYEDRAGYERLLDSTREFERVYVIDGKFTNQSGQGLYSPKEDLKMIESYKNVKLYLLSGDEIAKRNYYMQSCQQDLILWLDTDEYLIDCNMEQFKNSLAENYNPDYLYYGVPMIFNSAKPSYWPKLFARPQELEYYKIHVVMRHKCGFWTQHPQASANINDITIMHDASKRSPARQARRETYQDWLREHEDKLRVEMGLK